ncbi:MarR family winged helix-turn-helix transcriptional regulator [Vallitalea guaymasensis]|uniref:HTH-type transcriptional regulator SarZ n=1 Tax=Vallitalea guaymasensis TaxID=1185412 RepID=A0A8J8MB06_9FIRM|nr:MarR family transcriptional regulator [Vallitalea guaymasensis]QUH29400.1 MarR family transcriptional regulator [Vallitalea guaymasensis]
MENTYETLNDLLVNLFNEIMTIEEKALITDEFSNISITDMHIIEAIGLGNGRNMSSVAKDLEITVGTLTIAINNLVKKGYVNRNRSTKDRRVVLISLSDLGLKVYNHHALFHKNMIEDIIALLDEKEMEVFLKGVGGINDYFQRMKSKKVKYKKTKKNSK